MVFRYSEPGRKNTIDDCCIEDRLHHEVDIGRGAQGRRRTKRGRRVPATRRGRLDQGGTRNPWEGRGEIAQLDYHTIHKLKRRGPRFYCRRNNALGNCYNGYIIVVLRCRCCYAVIFLHLSTTCWFVQRVFLMFLVAAYLIIIV